LLDDLPCHGCGLALAHDGADDQDVGASDSGETNGLSNPHLLTTDEDSLIVRVCNAGLWLHGLSLAERSESRVHALSCKNRTVDFQITSLAVRSIAQCRPINGVEAWEFCDRIQPCMSESWNAPRQPRSDIVLRSLSYGYRRTAGICQGLHGVVYGVCPPPT